VNPAPDPSFGIVRAVVGYVPALVTRLRRRPPREEIAQPLLWLLAVGATLGGWLGPAAWLPPAVLALPLLLGGMLLSLRGMRRLGAVVAVCLVFDVVKLGVGGVRAGSFLVVLVTGLVAYEFARSREETGLSGPSGDAVLVELRARLEQQGLLPPLCAPWCAEVVIRPAGGVPFAGDFVVSALMDDHRLEIALVDVSGKGVEAGTRSLLLSGAMGGLLGIKTPEDFLGAANTYLVRQEWEEGFATALHLALDLTDGRYALASAGHPPAAHFDAGSGRWGLVDVEGPALGLLPDVRYETASGQLRPGDALLLYTDGLVEVPGRDLDIGIDKLLGEAERLVTQGFRGGGELLVDRVAERSGDDRGLVLLWRSHQ
jgi:hypothetical protein